MKNKRKKSVANALRTAIKVSVKNAPGEKRKNS